MTELIEILEKYPKTGATIIAIVAGTLGWVFRNIFQMIIDYLKHKKEIKAFFWKEKINSAKKASEFYLEYMNLLILAQSQFDALQSDNDDDLSIMENTISQVQFYSEKIKKFPHFEHHHINIFYDLLDTETPEISIRLNELNRELTALSVNQSDLPNKKKRANQILNQLKVGYHEIYEIQKGLLKKVRDDIKSFL